VQLGLRPIRVLAWTLRRVYSFRKEAPMIPTVFWHTQLLVMNLGPKGSGAGDSILKKNCLDAAI
jgi:hypothetical protein